jgi:hypothetical protein
MTVQKLSQIATAVTPPALTDTVIGVRGAAVDQQFSLSQLAATISAIGTVVVGGTPGSVLFIGGGGTLAQDNAQFFWDDSNHQLILGGSTDLAPVVPAWQSSAQGLRLGGPPSASPVNQAFQVQDVLPGTLNTPGANLGIQGSISTGIGAAGVVSIYTGFAGFDLGHTLSSISNASPAVLTTPVNHNLFSGETILLSTTGTLPAPLQPLTTYWVIAAGLTSTQFEIAASLNGAAINTTSAGSGTHAYVPGSTYTVAGINFFAPGNHGLTAGMILQFQTTGTFPTPLQPNTNYYITNIGATGFNISATFGGAPVNTSTSGTGTQTYQVQGGTTQNPAYPICTFGPSNLLGNNEQPAMIFNQVWNTDAQFPVGLAYSIFNNQFLTQNTKFQRYALDTATVNALCIYGMAGGLSWRIIPSDTPGGGAPYLDLTNTDFTLASSSAVILTSKTFTVGTLPAAGNKGARLFVTDATATTFAAIVAGGGTNNVPVYDDGTNWRIG